jgi:hypothetical protein
MSYLTRGPRRGIGRTAGAASRRHDSFSIASLVKEVVA